MQHREVLIMTNGVLFFPRVVAFSTAAMYALVHGQIPTHTPVTKPSVELFTAGISQKPTWDPINFLRLETKAWISSQYVMQFVAISNSG